MLISPSVHFSADTLRTPGCAINYRALHQLRLHHQNPHCPTPSSAQLQSVKPLHLWHFQEGTWWASGWNGVPMSYNPGWWWLEPWNFPWLSHHGNFIIPTDFHSMIFQRGRSTTNQSSRASAERHPSTARSSGLSAALHAYVTWSDASRADSVEQHAWLAMTSRNKGHAQWKCRKM